MTNWNQIMKEMEQSLRWLEDSRSLMPGDFDFPVGGEDKSSQLGAASCPDLARNENGTATARPESDREVFEQSLFADALVPATKNVGEPTKEESSTNTLGVDSLLESLLIKSWNQKKAVFALRPDYRRLLLSALSYKQPNNPTND